MDELTISLLLMLIGTILIVLELFIPSGGLLGLGAALTILAGVIVGFMGGFNQGLIILLCTSAAIPIVLYLAVRYWPHTPIGQSILNRRPNGDEEPQDQTTQKLQPMIGRRGVAKSQMLPSGLVVIEGQEYDAVSDGIAIEIGQAIEVVDVRIRRIIVRPVDPSAERMHSTSSQSSEEQEILSQPIEDLGIDPLENPLE